MITKDHRGLQRFTGNHKRLQEVIRSYRTTGVYKGDPKGLQEITRGYRGLQEFTGITKV